MLYSCSSLDDITQHPSSHVHWIEMKLTECFLYLLMFAFGVSSDMGIKLLKSPALSLIITLCLFQYRKIILLKSTKNLDYSLVVLFLSMLICLELKICDLNKR